MNTLKFLLSIASVLLLTCCASNTDPEGSKYIGLTASVGQMSVTAKAASSAIPFDNITSSTPLEAKVLFSQVRNAYPYNEHPSAPTFIPCHTTVTYTGADFVFVEYAKGNTLNNLTYPTTQANTEVYCTGLYPCDSEWTISTDGTSAEREIDGTTDIMFADIISGSWRNPFTVQNYKHLQSWIKVLVSANTNDAADKWGKVTKVTVKSEPTIQISFGNKQDGSSTIGYPGATPKDIVIYESATAQEGHQLSITTAELGSAFLVSPQATVKLTVYTTIFTEGRNVDVVLYDVATNQKITDRVHTIGNLYVLNLNFTNLDVIEGVCTLNYWNDQDDDLYLE